METYSVENLTTGKNEEGVTADSLEAALRRVAKIRGSDKMLDYEISYRDATVTISGKGASFVLKVSE